MKDWKGSDSLCFSVYPHDGYVLFYVYLGYVLYFATLLRLLLMLSITESLISLLHSLLSIIDDLKIPIGGQRKTKIFRFRFRVINYPNPIEM